ncbi:MAG: hypothetical protein H6767_10045 [Candidatus Peribacteria bacterium]|nr:MAG: hypothetical protein H6767_10045 [Candidatus Peribacteria bacterium]
MFAASIQFWTPFFQLASDAVMLLIRVVTRLKNPPSILEEQLSTVVGL